MPSSRKLPNRFLAIFLILTAIELSVWLWGQSPLITGWVGGIWLALGKLQMPAFFFFFISSCYSDFRLKWYDSLHLIPFCLSLVFNTIEGPSPTLFIVGTTASAILAHSMYYAYMTAIIFILWQFRQRFRLHHTGGRSEVLVWLTQFAAVSLFAHTVIVFRDGFARVISPEIFVGLQIFGALLALAITTWIALKSLFQPELFRDVDRRLLRLQAIDSITRDADLTRVLETMKDDELFLDPNLNLAELSNQLALTPRELSELLNGQLGVHFFDFVNNYRIEHAKILLRADPKCSVLQIVYESGFNSKSSFNTAFKKHTGLTPTAFRAQN
ncbi:MAG: helix-turn-helix domain-containing protein [Litorimonas sp.]